MGGEKRRRRITSSNHLVVRVHVGRKKTGRRLPKSPCDST